MSRGGRKKSNERGEGL